MDEWIKLYVYIFFFERRKKVYVLNKVRGMFFMILIKDVEK